MKLEDYLEDKGSRELEMQHRQEQLREALYRRLSVETIAMFAASDRIRAKQEVLAVLRMELRQPAFVGLAPDIGERLACQVADMAVGLGPIDPLMDDASVTEIMVNGPDAIFFERDGRISRSDVHFEDDAQLRAIIERIVAPIGRRVDEQTPMVSARLPQGYRVNVVLPPCAVDGPALNIRKFRETIYTLDELVDRDSLPRHLAQLLRWAVRSRCNIAVAGGTGSGKTTLLNALSVEIDPSERIVTIEDSAELRFSQHPHVVRLEARSCNTEGKGEVTIRDLVTTSLRMRPDRIVVGECRGAEALDMLQAMNTGHDGSMTTLHASSPEEVVSRLVMMSRYGADLPLDVIEEQIATALDLIVQLGRSGDGHRRLTDMVSVHRGPERHVVLEPVVKWDRRGGEYRMMGTPSWVDELETIGVATGEEVERWRASSS